MTEYQRTRLNVARSFATAFLNAGDDCAVSAMQLHAALEQLGLAIEGKDARHDQFEENAL